MKNNSGGAYVMVIVTCLLLLTVALTVLTVTAASRNATGRYGDFYGLYDLAVAGNEQAFFMLEEAYQNAAAAGEDFMLYFTNQYGTNFSVQWGLGVQFANLPNNAALNDNFSAITRILVGERVEIETEIHRLFGDIQGNRVTVRSVVKFLDDSGIEMVELFRE